MNEAGPIAQPIESFNKYEKAIRDTLAGNEARLQKEFDTTANPWLACYLTPLLSIRLNLEAWQRKASEDEQEKIVLALGIIDGIDSYVRELQGKYQDKNDLPPEEIRTKLMADLQRILE